MHPRCEKCGVLVECRFSLDMLANGRCRISSTRLRGSVREQNDGLFKKRWEEVLAGRGAKPSVAFPFRPAFFGRGICGVRPVPPTGTNNPASGGATSTRPSSPESSNCAGMSAAGGSDSTNDASGISTCIVRLWRAKEPPLTSPSPSLPLEWAR